MLDLTIAFRNSLKVLRRDKLIFILALIPILIGLGIYGLMSSWIYGHLLPLGRIYIEKLVLSGGWGNFIYYTIVTLFSILLFLFINYTFILFVSIISAPFNDAISSRVEKNLISNNSPGEKETFSEVIKNFFKTIFNEFKKVIFIFTLSLVAFLVALIPVLAPVGLILSGLLFAISFLDFSWSRHRYNLRRCLSDLAKSFIYYVISGSLFLLLMGIPIINIVILPYSVVFLTCLFVQRNLKANIDEEKNLSTIAK